MVVVWLLHAATRQNEKQIWGASTKSPPYAHTHTHSPKHTYRSYHCMKPNESKEKWRQTQHKHREENICRSCIMRGILYNVYFLCLSSFHPPAHIIRMQKDRIANGNALKQVEMHESMMLDWAEEGCGGGCVRERLSKLSALATTEFNEII